MSVPAPPGDAVRAAAGRLIGGWLRRYRGAAVGVLVFVAVVAALPSTSPDAPAEPAFASGRASVPAAAGGSVAGSTLTAAPDTAVSSYSPAYSLPPSEVASTPAPTADDGTVHTPAPAEPPAIPGAPACPVPLPASEAPPSGAPQLFGVFPLAGPFGPEALAFLPVLGHFFVLITPLLPVLQPGLDAAQPTMGQLVPLIAELEAIAFGPALPYIEQHTPEYLAYERQLVDVLEPIAVAATDNPAVTCVAQLEVLAAAQLAPKP